MVQILRDDKFRCNSCVISGAVPVSGYFLDRIIKAGKVVRAIAILSHPIPGTEEAQSAQIILPQRQTGRKNDIYVFCCSFAHNVCSTGKWLAFVSTTVETVDPEKELAQGAQLGLTALAHSLGSIPPLPLPPPWV